MWADWQPDSLHCHLPRLLTNQGKEDKCNLKSFVNRTVIGEAKRKLETYGVGEQVV